MGLPSGNRWAVSNLDVNGPYYFQESPFQYDCSFFSWGNVTPHNPISETEFDYDFGGVNPAAPYYEGQPYGETQGAEITGNIPLSMDAARKLLGSPWQMPKNEDYAELFANVIYIDANGNEVDNAKPNKLVSVNGAIGIYLQSKFNGARLFFCCTGLGNGRSWERRSSYGYYWTPGWDSTRNADYMLFYSGGVYPQNSGSRYRGFPLRPIWNPRDLRG